MMIWVNYRVLSIICLEFVDLLLLKQIHSAVIMGAITQVQVFNGLNGLAIAQAILTRSLDLKLSSMLSPQQVVALLDSIGSISDLFPAQATATRQVYSDVFDPQAKIVTLLPLVS